jgi:hypothetical protein
MPEPECQRQDDDVETGDKIQRTEQPHENTTEDIEIAGTVLSNLTLSCGPKNVLVCDATYPLPSESRPRKEQVRAIAKQLCNFLEWQTAACKDPDELAEVKIVLGSREQSVAIKERFLQLWSQDNLPKHVTLEINESLDTYRESSVYYLSPDADEVLSPSCKAPPTVIIGMIIDRKIKRGRSKRRADILGIQARRLPLDNFVNLQNREPLNVDTVLELMQQWWWNEGDKGSEGNFFVEAACQAIERHARRHPNRPIHDPF